MKQFILGAALLLAVSATQAAPRSNRPGQHNILSTELPATLQSDIKSTYGGYWITDLKEDGAGKHAKYMLTIENPDQVLHLEADNKDGWEVVKTDLKAV